MGASLRSAQERTHTDSRVIEKPPHYVTGAPKPVTPASSVLRRTPRPTGAAVAATLAQAFLNSARWTSAGLVEAGAQVLGARRRWLGPVVTLVLRSYPRPPLDAPRELGSMILGCEPFAQARAKAAVQRKPLRLAHYVLEPMVARENGQPRVPRLDTLADLAAMLELTGGELEWFADPQQWNRLAVPALQHYRYVWRRRPGRLPRLLEIPAPRLRGIQRTVLRDLLYPLEIHDAAHGFVPGRSAVTGATRHTGQDLVLTLDLVTFFARVTAGKVFGVLRRAGYTEAVAHRLVGLCTHVVPPRVLSAMPPGGSPTERFALRQALSQPHLPQGAPSSPVLANLSLRRLDARLAGLADYFEAVYTRYADDLAFSGGKKLARRSAAFIRFATVIIGEEGHGVNQPKSRMRTAGERQQVTSVVVNERTNAVRSEFDRLKATLHNCWTHGPDSQNREGHVDFRAHLLGRVSWMASLNSDRGARLFRDFQRIQW